MKALFSILLLLSFLSARSQDSDSFLKPEKFLELGISANSYRGDLNESFDKYAFGVHAALKFNHKERLNGKFNVMFGIINGQNVNYQLDDLEATPNTFFQTTLFSAHYELHVNLLKKKNYGIYFSQGIGILRFAPKDEYWENLENQFDTRASGESFSPITFILPTSLGGYYLLPNGYGIGLQLQYLNTQTDYLDNISEWGVRDKNDNVFLIKFMVYVPLKFAEPGDNTSSGTAWRGH